MAGRRGWHRSSFLRELGVLGSAARAEQRGERSAEWARRDRPPPPGPGCGPRPPPPSSCTLPQSGEFPVYGTTRLPAQRSGSLLSPCLAWRKDCRCHSAVWLALGRRSSPSFCCPPGYDTLAGRGTVRGYGHECLDRARVVCFDRAFRQWLRPELLLPLLTQMQRAS